MVRGHGFGLYYHDCRYLNGYELLVGGEHPEPLAARSEGGRAVFQLTTPDFQAPDGRTIHRETVGLKWDRVIDAEQCVLHEQLDIQCFGYEAIDFPLTMRFRAGFEDVFEIRGLLREVKGKLFKPVWKDKCLVFSYEGGDKIRRSLAGALLSVAGRDQGRHRPVSHFAQAERGQADPYFAGHRRVGGAAKPAVRANERVPRSADRFPRHQGVRRTLAETRDGIPQRQPAAQPRDAPFADGSAHAENVHRRGRILRGRRTWFVALFGRDCLTTSLQTMAFWSDTPAPTLRLLARHQGTQVSDWRDEQPGKILHELRVGELARMNKIPHTPYYGTIDATPLFLVLMSRQARWTGDLDLFRELRVPVERALHWIDKYGDVAGDGYVSYLSNTNKGLINQGWKDSGDAMVTEDGRFAEPPIALAEVQGYVYMAKREIADLYERIGEREYATRLRAEARALRARFNRDFWIEEEGCYAMALEAGHRPCRVMSSNAGQALWTGIVEEDKAGRMVQRLMKPDLFNGWGIRTLSYKERRYNPMGYHLGTVWPHDNSLIAAGFRRYGYDEEATRIFVGLLEAAMEFEDYRLPELFTGFGREEYGQPVRYPVACHPQAWAAGSIPFLVETFLGLAPDAFNNRLKIIKPSLPEFINQVELRHLRVGQSSVNLRFERKRDRSLEVQVGEVTGDLKVEVET